ncbi:MAG: UDP-N-acetylmuramate dehydrogenase [Desulfovibrio sp.]
MSLKLIESPALHEQTTLGLGGNAAALAVVESEQGLDELNRYIDKYLSHEVTPFAMGRGSNLLAKDCQLPLLLIQPNFAESEITFTEKSDSEVLVRANAGVSLPKLMAACMAKGLSGLESLTGIPGSVGGAMGMNAGSYGTQFGDLLERVKIWQLSEGTKWLKKKDTILSYRHFSPRLDRQKNNIVRGHISDVFFLIVEVELLLKKSTKNAVKSGMKEVRGKKNATQPVTARSAGCVFKNPEGHSAGLLLDRAGFKGYKKGVMAFSEMHANFLINTAPRGTRGSSDDALELIASAQEKVLNMFDVTLETEVIILP